MYSKVLIKAVLAFSFSLFIYLTAQAQSQHVIVILNDKTSYVGEMLEMTPDSVTIIDEDTGENLVLNGLDISSVYIKEQDKTVKYPMTEELLNTKAEKINPKRASVPEGYIPPKEQSNYGNDYTYQENQERIRISVGFGAGGLSGIAKAGIKDFKDTEFIGGTCLSGYLNVFFGGDVSAGLLVQQMDMDLEENGTSFGTITLTPVIFMMQFYNIPQNNGLGGHAGIGIGVNFADFETGGFVTQLEQQYGSKIVVKTDNAVVFELNAGFDYFFTQNIALMMEGRLLLGNIGTSWNVNSSRIDGFDTFLISNFQYLAGLRAWF